MAQVKKLQGGGTPSKKYLMFNGTKIVEGDDNFKQLEQYALNGNRGAQSMLNTLRSNNYDNSMIINTSDTGVDFKNVDMSYYNDRTGKQFEKGDNFWRRNFRTKEGKDYIKDFTALKFAAPATEEKKEDVKLGILSHGNDADFVYHDQEDGTKLYSTGPQNMQNEKVIRDIFSNLGSTREDLEKKYNFDNWGENFWTLQNWYNANRNYDIDALINRIRTGKASDSDIELLQLMRFNVGATKNKPEPTKITGLEFDDTFLNGITNTDQIKQAAARRGVGIKKGDDGNWYVTGNTDFINGTWYAGDLDFLEGTPYAGGAIHNGRLFTKQQVLSGDPGIAQYISPFISAWRNASDYRSGYDAANNSNVRFVGDRLWNNASNDHYGPFNVQFDPNTQYHRVWSDYFDKIDSEHPWNITDVTGSYDGLDGRQVIAYIDPSEQNKRDIGMFGADWVVYDPNNAENPYQVFDNEISMRNALGLTQTSDPYGYSNNFTTSTWTNIGNQAYAIRDVIKTKGGQENTILIGNDGFLYLARKNQSGGFESPKRITNLELLNKVLQNPQDYDNAIIDQLTAPVNNNITPEIILDNADYMLHALGKMQHGGILKLAYGNTVHASNTTSSIKNTEDAKTDITKDHLLNGKDGGLTQAEKMQIGAAIGDLAGVGISFMGPVGNITGAVTGLGATATRFAADVKQDGFQAKDAWNAALGATLDFASMIPFIGTGAKTAKALKVIKSAANPIMKVLSLYGAVNGAVAMSKVISGEKITSEDLQAIIGGLSSSLIAGKQFKDMIGDSKLASMLSKRVADSTNASKSISPKAKIGDTEIELDVAKINDKSEAEVIKYIKETAKTKLGRELTNSESKGLLEQFGLNVVKGEKVGMRWKNLLNFKNPVVRKSGKVEFETPEDVSGNGTLYYMLNPFAREKALGKGWHGFARNKGLLSEISENDIKGAQRRIKNNKGSLKDYSLMRQTIDNPAAFGDLFEGVPYRLSEFGYPVYTRPWKPIWKRNWTPTMQPIFTADVESPISLGSHLNVELNSLPRASVLKNRAKIASFKGRKLMEPTLTHPYGEYYDDVVIMEKQGGILKAQGGVYNLNRIESDWKKKQPTLHSEILTTPIKSILTNDELNTKREQYLNTNRYDSGDGSLGKEIDWDKFGIESLNVANFIRPFGEASKLRGLNKKDSQSLFQMQGSTPPKPDFRYQNSVSNQYDSDLANLYLRARYQNQQTSDPKVQAANNAHANQLAIEHLNNKHQQTMSAWNDFLNKQEVSHNQWMQSAWQNYLRNLQIQNAANNIVTNGERNIQSQMSSILDKFAYKLQSDMYKNGQVELDRQNKLYQLDLMLSKAKTDEERAQLNKIISQLKSEDYINNMKQNAFYRKKGGKLRSTSDQMLIDNQKQVAKAIEKLNDNTMKLILKALS